MQTCAVCSASIRPGARFCTQCGAPVHAAPVPVPVTPALVPIPVAPFPVAPAPVPPVPVAPEAVAIEPERTPSRATPVEIPTRIPTRGRMTAPAERSTAATWALITGAAPLIVSVVGNLVAAQLGATALEQTQQGDRQGAWAPVLVVLAIVFVANAGLLTVCVIMGGRGLRETANGITRGRGLAVAGLAVGGVNLVLWVSGLLVSISSLGPVFT